MVWFMSKTMPMASELAPKTKSRCAKSCKATTTLAVATKRCSSPPVNSRAIARPLPPKLPIKPRLFHEQTRLPAERPMGLRAGHGKGAGTPRIEVLPPDELPAGMPGPARPEAVRDASGKFVPGAGTSELARQGAKAAHESRQLAALLGLWEPPPDHPFAPYARLAREWRDNHMAQL